MLPEALECPVAPPEALLEQRTHRFWGFGDGFGERCVYDASAVLQEREGEISVFYERIARISTDIQYLLPFPGPGGSGYDRDAVERIKGTPVVVLSCHVFHFLECREDILHVADSYIAAHRVHFLVYERLHEVEYGFRQDDGIGVDRDHVVVFRFLKAQIQGF